MRNQDGGVSPNNGNLLSKFKFTNVDEARKCEDCHSYDVQEQAQLLVCLLKGVEQGLQTSKMLEQLVDSEYPQHFQESDNLPGFSDYFKILQPFQHERDVEGDETEKIYNIHWLEEEFYLVRGAEEAGKILK